MRKGIRWGNWLKSLSVVGLAIWSTTAPALAQDTDAEEIVLPPDPLGICQMSDLAGRTIVNAEGQLITLVEFCRQQQFQQQVQSPVLEIEAAAFWQAFLSVASTEAIAFSQTVDPQQVVEYGATICPFLENGGTLQQIRQIQSEDSLPVAFDAAVSVAAIHTYCPDYRSAIGR